MNKCARYSRLWDDGVKARILMLVVITLMLAILNWATLRAYAAWYFLAARSVTTVMIESDEITPPGINEATTHIRKALGRFPQNPDYLDLAGQLQVLRAGLPGVVGKAHRESLEKAADYYRRSLSVRPLWPYCWADLLGVKDRLGIVDGEFRLALTRSIETGPWEPRVQLQVINSGLRHWDQLRKRERNMVRDTLRNALTVQPKKVFGIVKEFGRPDLLCGQGSDFAQIEKWCSSVLIFE